MFVAQPFNTFISATHSSRSNFASLAPGAGLQFLDMIVHQAMSAPQGRLAKRRHGKFQSWLNHFAWPQAVQPLLHLSACIGEAPKQFIIPSLLMAFLSPLSSYGRPDKDPAKMICCSPWVAGCPEPAADLAQSATCTGSLLKCCR